MDKDKRIIEFLPVRSNSKPSPMSRVFALVNQQIRDDGGAA